MESNRICRSLIRKNLTRHWLLLLAACVYFFIFVSISINDLLFLHDLRNMETLTQEDLIQKALANFESNWRYHLYSLDVGIFEFLFAAVAPLCTFSYLHKKQENHFYHSLPTKKNNLFLSSLTSGFLFYAIPWLVTTLITTPVIYCIGEGNKLIWVVYLQAMVFRLALYLIAYSIAGLATVLCGRRFFSLLLTFLFHCLPPMLEEYFYLILENNLFGISTARTNFSDIFCPFIYLAENFYYEPSPPWGALGIYAALSFGILFLAAVLHRKRKEENVGQSLVFPALSLCFQYLFTMLIAFLGVQLLDNLEVLPFENSSLVFPCLILTPVAFFLSRMLMLRSKKVFQKKAFLQCGIFSLCFLTVILVFQFDLLGIVRRVPKPEKVERLTVSLNGMTFTTEDPEDIADFTQVHKLIVNNRDLLIRERKDSYLSACFSFPNVATGETDYHISFSTLDITYEKKGQDIYRSYTLTYFKTYTEPIWDALEAYFREGDRATRQVLQLREEALSISISQRLWEADPDTLDGPRYILSTAQIDALFQALASDMAEGGKPLILQEEGLYGIEVTVRADDGTFRHFHPHKSLKNTCALLDSILDTYETTE